MSTTVLAPSRAMSRTGRAASMAAGILPQPLSHAEVVECAERVKREFTRLLELMIDIG